MGRSFFKKAKNKGGKKQIANKSRELCVVAVELECVGIEECFLERGGI